MKSIFRYRNHKKLLLDWKGEQKLSYRQFTEILGYATMSYGYEFLHGQKPMPERALSNFAIQAGLDMDTYHYLRAMTNYNQCDDVKRKKFYFKIMKLIKESRR